jgi:hypothetical protein
MLAATELAPLATDQLELFPPERAAPERLRDILGRLGPRHTGSLLRATLTAPHARLPERRSRLDPLEST